MPATVKEIKGRWRVVEESTGHPVKNDSGTAIDGGGHDTRDGALAQMQALNIRQHESKKTVDPVAQAIANAFKKRKRR